MHCHIANLGKGGSLSTFNKTSQSPQPRVAALSALEASGQKEPCQRQASPPWPRRWLNPSAGLQQRLPGKPLRRSPRLGPAASRVCPVSGCRNPGLGRRCYASLFVYTSEHLPGASATKKVGLNKEWVCKCHNFPFFHDPKCCKFSFFAFFLGRLH